MSELSIPESDPEPQPSNVYYLVPSERFEDGLQNNFEELAERETIEAIVDQVRKLTQLEDGERDKFLFNRPKMIFDSLGNRVWLNTYPPFTATNSHIATFHKENLHSKVVGIDIQPSDGGEEEIYSVTNEGNSGTIIHMLNRHRHHVAIDPKTNKEVQVETIEPVGKAGAIALRTFLESLQNSQ